MINLIGKKIKGFRFKGDLLLNFPFEMEDYIEVEGVIVKDTGDKIQVEFVDGMKWFYPKEKVLKILGL